VAEQTSRNQRWSLTRESLDRLLEELGPDRDSAAERFESLRRRLIIFFTCRGTILPDRWADETLDRAAKRLMDGKQMDDVASFLHGAAKLVLLEARKEEAQERGAQENIANAKHGRTDNVRLECLEHCMARLSADKQQLIEQYFGGESSSLAAARASLRKELGIGADALRTRAMRIRRTLQECVRTCRERREERGDTFATFPPSNNEGPKRKSHERD